MLAWCSNTMTHTTWEKQLQETPMDQIVQENYHTTLQEKVSFWNQLYRSLDDKQVYYIECDETTYKNDCPDRKVLDENNTEIIFDEYLGWKYFKAGSSIYVHKDTHPIIWGRIVAVPDVDINSFKVYSWAYAYDKNTIYIDNIAIEWIPSPITSLEIFTDGLYKINNIWLYHTDTNTRIFTMLSDQAYLIDRSLLYNPTDKKVYHAFTDDGSTASFGPIDGDSWEMMEDHDLETEGEDGYYRYYHDKNWILVKYVLGEFDGTIQKIVIIEE